MTRIFLKNTIHSLFILLLCSQVIPKYAQADEILIYIRDDVYKDYLQFVDGRDVLNINSFSGNNIRRDVVDMIIAQQALKLGGFEHTFSYASGKLNFRNTKMLQVGRLLMSFDSYWLLDAKALNDDVYISDAVIRNGEYIAGIYTSPLNKKVLSINSVEHLSQLTSVSTPKWRTDWQTLQALPLKKLIREIISGRVSRIVLTHKDRLLRFGSEIIFYLCSFFGCKIELIE